MSIDLERALLQIAGSVHDDATTARMSGQVHHMVTRIRRRRAARHTAQGVVGVAAVAAVVLAGAQGLGGRDTALAPSATEEPQQEDPSNGSEQASDLETCFPLDLAEGAGIGLTAGAEAIAPVALGENLDVQLTLTGTGETATDISTLTPEIVVTLDGRPVGARNAMEGTDTVDALEPGETQIYRVLHNLADCSGTTLLPPGAYEAYAVGQRGDDPASIYLGGPWPFSVHERSPEEEAVVSLTADSERVLAEILANPNPAPFPACGSEVWLDDGQPPLLLDLDLPPATYAPGADVTGRVTLRTTEERHVVARTSVPTLVLAKDGVVVARSVADDLTVLTDLTAGATSSQEVEGSLHLCTTEPRSLRLPAGTYQAYGVVEGELTEVTYPDGTTEGPLAGLLAANYIPAEVVVE
ncbi:hypothetical protein [Actinotalea sp. K2]|uniref:hypothetical protein n=1 Tax=Actinotalea sp. K2 TaxID=2939438 RepID=UPI00201739D8|nr:hypothetical protein [Actinotalea sp. K2]MCL3861381.1 hypothetical protein [Actinotalea sp. K2]